jgi:hypothetical protein
VVVVVPAKKVDRPVEPVPRYALTRAEAAASLGMSVNHFDERVRPFVKVITCGQLQLVPPDELERWVRANARFLADQVA